MSFIASFSSKAIGHYKTVKILSDEFFGIETGFTTPVDAYDWLKNRFKDPGGEVGTWDAFWDVNFKQDFERFFGGRT